LLRLPLPVTQLLVTKSPPFIPAFGLRPQKSIPTRLQFSIPFGPLPPPFPAEFLTTVPMLNFLFFFFYWRCLKFCSLFSLYSIRVVIYAERISFPPPLCLLFLPLVPTPQYIGHASSYVRHSSPKFLPSKPRKAGTNPLSAAPGRNGDRWFLVFSPGSWVRDFGFMPPPT